MPKTVHQAHGQIKEKVSLGLTQDGKAGLDCIAKEMNLSRSELVEQIGRGIIPIAKMGKN